jgi:hypothetical protein
MNKLIVLLTLAFAIASCKGPKTGPLVKDAFSKNGQDQVQDKGMNRSMDGKTHAGQVTVEKMNVSVEPCNGCTTIAKLLEDKKSLAGKVIKIKGKVTKYNP